MKKYNEKELIQLGEKVQDFIDRYHDIEREIEIVELIEQRFAHKFGQNNPILTRSGTDSFLGILWSLGLKDDDEVILPVSICQSMVNSVMIANAVPTLVDVEEDLSISLQSLLRHINKKTKVIVFFHPYGLACDVRPIKRIIQQCKHKIYLIEDCVQSIGTQFNHNPIGQLGDFAIYSFGKQKPVSVGMGGIVCVNNTQFYDKIKMYLRTGVFGIADDRVAGLNSTMSFLDMVLLYKTLQAYERIVEQKIRKAKIYIEQLQDVGTFIGLKNKQAENLFHRVVLSTSPKSGKNYQRIISEIQNELKETVPDIVQSTIPIPL